MARPRKSTHPARAAVSRRQPVQARAEATVQAIFQATAQVLRDEGEAALTTNRIAERAGVSIGTLYQYFDSKEAIVLAILQRGRQRMLQQMDALLESYDPDAADPEVSDPRALLRAFVRAYVRTLGTGAPGQRALVRLAWRLDSHQAIVQSMREASDRLVWHLHRMQHPQLRPPTPMIAFVLTRALAGIVRAAALEESPWLGTGALEDELVNACWGVMARPTPA